MIKPRQLLNLLPMRSVRERSVLLGDYLPEIELVATSQSY